MAKVPNRYELQDPVLQALKQLGGSGTNEEIYEKVIENLKLPSEIVDLPHGKGAAGRTALDYEMAWARTYLKNAGKIDAPTRGVWTLLKKGDEVFSGNEEETKKQQDESVPDEERWKDNLHRVLTVVLTPKGFERLIQRMLRESGFVQVEITGQNGDGGIDGRGIVRLNGFLTFHVLFQCKRYAGAVGVEKIRDFRGAMEGRADKGLFITTGYFTREAEKEATRDGVRPIELVDGEHLAEKLRELRLGLKVEAIEHVSVDEEWFKSISEVE
jgi:restriction system protein